MKCRAPLLLIVALLCTFATTFAASPKELSVSRDDLSSIAQGKNGIGAGAGVAGYFPGRDSDTTMTYVTIRP